MVLNILLGEDDIKGLIILYLANNSHVNIIVSSNSILNVLLIVFCFIFSYVFLVFFTKHLYQYPSIFYHSSIEILFCFLLFIGFCLFFISIV